MHMDMCSKLLACFDSFEPDPTWTDLCAVMWTFYVELLSKVKAPVYRTLNMYFFRRIGYFIKKMCNYKT